jgi:acyl carrier protein
LVAFVSLRVVTPGERSAAANTLRRKRSKALPGDQDLIDRTLAVVRTLLVDIVDPGGSGPPVDLDTSFDVDLELDSLDFVALAERLRAHFGEQVDFVDWLATLELDEMIALTVGDLVAFVASMVATPAVPRPTFAADG